MAPWPTRSDPTDPHEGAVERWAAPGVLDLHEGISHPRPQRACERWPENLLLRGKGPDGTTFVKGRCKASNKCDYCGRLAAVETAELLFLDAVEYAPTTWAVLTTVDPKHGPKELWRHLEVVVRSVRARFPNFEYAALVEYTTGLAPRSGGHRRLHLNLVIKGVPENCRGELEELLRRRWHQRTGAHQVFVGELASAGGVIRYLALHFEKASQAPPLGWKGHRVRYSRGYLVRPASVLREEARRSLRDKRRLWKALQLLDPDGSSPPPAEFVELVVDDMRAREEATTWELWDVYRAPGATVREPIGPLNADGIPPEAARLVRWRGHLVNATTGEVWD